MYAITITSGVFLVSPIRSGLNFKKALSRAPNPCVLFRQVESDLNTGRQTSLSCLYGHLNVGKKNQKTACSEIVTQCGSLATIVEQGIKSS